MSNIPEETGKVVSNAIDAMKNTPGLLAVIMLQVLTMGMIYLVSSGHAERQQVRELQLMQYCFPEYEKM